MTFFWMTIAAMGGFALGFLVCAMCTVSKRPTPTQPSVQSHIRDDGFDYYVPPEPPKRDAS